MVMLKMEAGDVSKQPVRGAQQQQQNGSSGVSLGKGPPSLEPEKERQVIAAGVVDRKVLDSLGSPGERTKDAPDTPAEQLQPTTQPEDSPGSAVVARAASDKPSLASRQSPGEDANPKGSIYSGHNRPKQQETNDLRDHQRAEAVTEPQQLEQLSSYESLEGSLNRAKEAKATSRHPSSAPEVTQKAFVSEGARSPSRRSTTPPKMITTPTAQGAAASISLTPASTPPPAAAAPASGNRNGKNGNALRRGKWTVEEEAYVARVIQDFNSGFLDAPAGTTLRTYLSEKLQCDPMRITKKFTGDACIGKRVFHPAVRSPSNAFAIDKAQADLEALERRWRRRLEMQQRESAKKAAASAAAAAAAAARTNGGGVLPAAVEGATAASAIAGGGHPTAVVGVETFQQNVTRTASWLERAKSVLKAPAVGGADGAPASNQQQTTDQIQSLPQNEIVSQMQEVQRLIHEGPIIQETSAGLAPSPQLLESSQHHQQQQQQEQVAPEEPQRAGSPPVEPADKRMRTGAEDAEALVGFLRSVRASAASAQGM